jgi:nucleoside-diphosphate-sugar epimerase
MNLGETSRPPLERRIVVLGAGGYLGRSLCHFFHGLPGYSVTALFRSAPSHFSFDKCIVADAFSDNWADRIGSPAPIAMINCAFDFAAVGETNLAAKYAAFDRNLAALCANAETKLVNISSMSAYPGCCTNYGREKLFVEEVFNKYIGLNIRPGLIASWRRPGAAMLSLIEVTRNSKFIPVLLARNSGFYVCDLEVVILALFLLIGLRRNKPHTLSFCYRDRLSLRDTLELIETRYAIAKPKIPVPWLAAYLLLRLKEAVVGKSKIRADSVLDFAHPAPFAQARGVFARIVEDYRNELEPLSLTERAPSGFYFLEGSAEGRSASRPCRLKRIIGAEPLTALGRLADT